MEDRAMSIGRRTMTLRSLGIVAAATALVAIGAVRGQDGKPDQPEVSGQRLDRVVPGEEQLVIHAYRGVAADDRLTGFQLDLGAGLQPPPAVGGQNGRAWGPEQATGEPNVPTAADDGRAWASRTPDGQDEWLELGYETPVATSRV